MPDALAGASWACAATPPGLLDGPRSLDRSPLQWIGATVPGTAAGALRAVGRWGWAEGSDGEVLDGQDWWWRCRIAARAGRWWLLSDGLATFADVWVDDVHVLASRSMWRRHRVQLDLRGDEHELVLRFTSTSSTSSAAAPAVGAIAAAGGSVTAPARGRRQRARWRSGLAPDPASRWVRTSLWGRIPGWGDRGAAVGPWRPLRLLGVAGAPVVLARSVRAVASPGPVGGVCNARLLLDGVDAGAEVSLRCGAAVAPLRVVPRPDGCVEVEGSLALPDAARWWPHTHGRPVRHDVEVLVGDRVVDLGAVGFRSIIAERGGGGFEVVVNGVRAFARGAVWDLPDPVGLDESPAALRPSLEAAVAAGANMVRVSGVSRYPPPALWELCDELGVMVWLDCMLAGYDPPEDPGWLADLGAEVAEVLDDAAGHPSLAVVAGGNETYQQAAMFGLPAEGSASTALDVTVPAAVEQVAPGTTYVASAPIGGWPPFDPSTGVAHYFGVGAYRRPLDDARRSGVRFAAECLAFATAPDHPQADGPWRPRDPGASWDFADVVDHYARELFGVDLPELRRVDPAAAHHAGRAAVGQAVGETFAEWRRPGSPCAGGLVLDWQDHRPGAGWGLVDVDGRAKAPLWVLARLWAPVAVWTTDEGLSGLAVHVANDGPEPFGGSLRLRVIDATGHVTDEAVGEVGLGPHEARTVGASSLLGVWRDLTSAYHFGPPAHVAVVVDLLDDTGAPVSSATYLPPTTPMWGGGQGLEASLRPDGGGWALDVRCSSVAAWVTVEVGGWTPSDNWRHVVPGVGWTVALTSSGGTGAPSGEVRALGAAPVALLHARPQSR